MIMISSESAERESEHDSPSLLDGIQDLAVESDASNPIDDSPESSTMSVVQDTPTDMDEAEEGTAENADLVESDHGDPTGITATMAVAALHPREYQLTIFEHAKKRNVIAVLETGAGKTLVSVLLIRHMLGDGHRSAGDLSTLSNGPEEPIGTATAPSSPESCPTSDVPAALPAHRQIVAFLVNHVSLVAQQANFIRNNTTFSIGEYSGSLCIDRWNAQTWKREVEQQDVLVMTVQILLNLLRHGYVFMQQIALIVIDECHHNKKRHPYKQLMDEFYYTTPTRERPKIFAMTASPLDSKSSVHASANALERDLDATIYTVDDIEQLRKYVKRPQECIVYYEPADVYDTTPLVRRLRRYCAGTYLRSYFKDAHYALETLGPWCSDQIWRTYLQSIEKRYPYSILLDTFLEKLASEDRIRVDRSLRIIRAHNFDTPQINLRYMSPKVIRLLEVLLAFVRQLPSFRGIVFVDRRKTVYGLVALLRDLPNVREVIRCRPMIGGGSSAIGDYNMNYLDRNNIVDDFRCGKVNLLIATNVGEEGLDIPACNVVVRFNFFDTLRAYIQSRGRARHPQSAYIIMRELGNFREAQLLLQTRRYEQYLNEWCQQRQQERNQAAEEDDSTDDDDVGAEEMKEDNEPMESLIAKAAQLDIQDTRGQDKETNDSQAERVDAALQAGHFIDPSSGARVTLSSAVDLVHRYCSHLPCDAYSSTKPLWHMDRTSDGTFLCTLRLPNNAAVRTVLGEVARTAARARRLAAMRACIELHRIGALDDRFLPGMRGQRAHHEDIQQIMDEAAETLKADEASADANGQRVTPVLQGQHGALYVLPRKCPDVWQVEQPPTISTENPDDSAQLWYIHNLQLRPVHSTSISAAQLHHRYRPMVILTRSAMPPLYRMDIYLDEGPCEYHIQPWTRPFLLNAQVVEYATLYTARLFTQILRKPIVPIHAGDVGYLILPLVTDDTLAAEQSIQSSIDWPDIFWTLSCTEPGANAHVDPSTIVPGMLVVDNSRYSALMEVVAVRHDLSPLTPLPSAVSTANNADTSAEAPSASDTEDAPQCVSLYDQVKGVSDTLVITNTQQPLLQVRRLKRRFNFLLPRYMANSSEKGGVKGRPTKKDRPKQFDDTDAPPDTDQLVVTDFSVPSLCRQVGLKVSVFRTAMILPSLLYFTESALLAWETGARFQLHTTLPNILTALTTTSAGLPFDYERLEMLGDSFLKLLSSSDLFLRYAHNHEGQLHARRILIISNRALCRSSIKHTLYAYINRKAFARRSWLPYGYRFGSSAQTAAAAAAIANDSSSNRREDQVLSEKMLADVVEASLGACVLVDDTLNAALHCARQLGVPFEEDVSCWADFQRYIPDSPLMNDTQRSVLPVNIAPLEQRIGYRFQRPLFLLEALTHTSADNPPTPCYQRLEFLGDALLDFFVVNLYFHRHPDKSPGQLSAIKDATVSNAFLSTVCDHLVLQRYMLHFSEPLLLACASFSSELAKLRKETGGQGEYWHGLDAPKVMGDLVESLLGAVYIDSGYQLPVVYDLFARLILPLIDKHIHPEKLRAHPTSRINSILQRSGCVQYKISDAMGPDGQSIGRVSIHGQTMSEATGDSSRHARLAASSAFLERWDAGEQDLLLLACDCNDMPRRSAKKDTTAAVSEEPVADGASVTEAVETDSVSPEAVGAETDVEDGCQMPLPAATDTNQQSPVDEQEQSELPNAELSASILQQQQQQQQQQNKTAD